jgi:hypothetical protein
VVVGVIALVVVAGFLLLGGDDLLPGGDGGTDAPGDFSFQLQQVGASTFSDTPAGELRTVARDAGDGVKATMDEFYFRAFVDAGSWGEYGDAFALFDRAAAARAEEDTDILTLGASAGEEYERLEPTLGTLTIVVLMDGNDRPVTAIAEVEFAADAELTDGSRTVVASSGSYFLRRAGDAWRIFAYRLTREETAAGEASPAEDAE